MLASIVIATYNRAAALPSTLEALAHQDVPASDYEVLVIDDGSTDSTPAVLDSVSVPFRMSTYRMSRNRGVSAARNLGLRNATGRYIVLISDDLLVPPNFIRSHVATMEAYPNAWVVGGFSQLSSLTDMPFGRFLDQLEKKFERARITARIDDGLYEMGAPTARNLSLRRSDLERIGLFDERFRVTCEDQDLGQRAQEQGIRFLYNAALDCVHNDQAADLKRYCLFQQRGAADTARLCAKYPDVHGGAPIARLNGYLARRDGARLAARKVTKDVLATAPAMRMIERAIATGERLRLPDAWLFRGYRLLIGLHTFRGFREGLAEDRPPLTGRQSDQPRA
jgi:GT2 family glycosyltransferase